MVGGYRQQLLAHADDGRDAQGARQNSRMGCQPTFRRTQTKHQLRVEAGCFRRAQVVGHDDGCFRQFVKTAEGHAQQLPQQPATDVSHIGRARREIFVLHRLKLARKLLDSMRQRLLCVLPLANPGKHHLLQRRITDNTDMGPEYVGGFRVGGVF